MRNYRTPFFLASIGTMRWSATLAFVVDLCTGNFTLKQPVVGENGYVEYGWRLGSNARRSRIFTAACALSLDPLGGVGWFQCSAGDFGLWPILLQSPMRSSSPAIFKRKFFNQHCALMLGLESILRTGPIKIVQQNRPTAANIDLCSNVCCRGVKRT
jgi:hypothetical protein